MAAGEIKAGEKNELLHSYKAGIYNITWQRMYCFPACDEKVKSLQIPDNTMILSSPKETKMVDQ